MKKYLIGFVIGALVFSGIGVAAYSILANDVKFIPKNDNWQVENVNDALNSLYISKTSDNYSTEEKVIGTWMNKPLYQRVFVFPFTSYTASFTGDLNLDQNYQIRRAEVYHSYSDGKGIESARYGNSSYYFSWYISGNKVVVNNNINNVTTYDIVVIAQYTKSTD